MAERFTKRNGLYKDENVLWTLTPEVDKEYCKADRWLVPLFAVLLALSVFWTVLMCVVTWRHGFDLHRLIGWGVAVFLTMLSVYGFFIRFAVKRRIKRELVYGFTDHGRLIVSDSGNERSIIYSGTDLKHAWISEMDRHGTGTIYLNRDSFRLDNTGLQPINRNRRLYALYDIRDCKRILHELRTRA